MRSERFGLILSEHEKEALARLAEADGGLSAAALVRRLVRQEAKRRGLWPPVAERSELAEVKPA
jgi:hypothetical protein